MVKETNPWYFRLPLGKSLLSAALTLALVILPIVIISSQEAIRAVPNSIREAAFGMGATRWQVVRKTVLPAATPGIMTGAILSMSRAIGEAAPVIAVMGSVLGTTRGIESLMSQTPCFAGYDLSLGRRREPWFRELPLRQRLLCC